MYPRELHTPPKLSYSFRITYNLVPAQLALPEDPVHERDGYFANCVA